MEYIYISLIWYEIPELVVPVMMSTTERKVPCWSHHFESFTVATNDFDIFFVSSGRGLNSDGQKFHE
jgi:hypothetical protein